MNDFDWEYELSGARRAESHRRLSIERRDYDVVAFDAGNGCVGVRVTGWESGFVVTELAGEVPARDALDVGNQIASVLAGFRVFDDDPPPRDGSARPPTDWWATRRAAAPNSGKPWDPQDLELLMARFQEGASIKSLTAELGRTEGGVRSRLQILGMTRSDPSPAPDRHGVARPDGEPDGPMPIAG